MQSEPIPDEVWQIAIELAAALNYNLLDPEDAEPIARALLARDRRAAEIAHMMAASARHMSKDSRYNKFERRDFDTMAIAYAQAATAILTYKEADNG